MEPIHSAAKAGDTNRLKDLLANGWWGRPADVNARDRLGDAPLHHAALQGRVEAVSVLLAAGADMHARNHRGHTPLHLGALSGDSQIVELLVSGGADVNARSNSGDTPLHMAVLGNHESIAQFLISKGADPQGRNNDNDKPASEGADELRRQSMLRRNGYVSPSLRSLEKRLWEK